MAHKYQHQIDAMTEAQQEEYHKTKFLAYLAGMAALFSFWILIPLSALFPSNGKFGGANALMNLAPLGVLIALIGLSMSFALKAKCRELREAALYSVKNEKSDQA